MNYSKLIIISIILILMCSCGNSVTKTLEFDNKNTKITLVESESVNLLSIEYLLVNNTDATMGPYYTKILFHDEKLSELVGVKEFAYHEVMGDKESLFTIKNNELYRSGANFELMGDINSEELKEIIEGTRAIEIQLLELDSKEVILNYWINDYNSIDY